VAVDALEMRYTINLNVCKCVDGQKQTLEPFPEIVDLFEVEQYFDKHGATLQVLQPQQHQPPLADLLAELESYFGCLVGSNVYITPASSKGLAPHYDDVEVFIVQLEGTKRWWLHAPLTELPNECSGDLLPEQIGEPLMEFVMEPGDVLYFPRGWVHHAETGPDTHSAHITISTYQKHTFQSLLEEALPCALKDAALQMSQFRQGLPLPFFSEAGVAVGHPVGTPTSAGFTLLQKTAEGLVARLVPFMEAAIHEAADQMAVDYIQSRLPPSQRQWEEMIKGYEHLRQEEGQLGPYPDKNAFYVRILNPSVVRMVIIEDEDSSDEEEDDEEEEERLAALAGLDPSMLLDGEEDEETVSSVNSQDEESSEEIPLLVAARGAGKAGTADECSDDEDDEDMPMAVEHSCCDDDDCCEEDDEDEEEAHSSQPRVVLFYSTGNEPEHHMGPSSEEQHYWEYPIELAPTIAFLLQAYPRFIQIADIPLVEENKELFILFQEMIVTLWAHGLLLTSETNPLVPPKKRSRSRSPQKKKKKAKHHRQHKKHVTKSK